MCKQVDPLCRTHDSNSGVCTSCYPGYTLANGQCSIVQASQIPNCNVVNSAGACVECLSGYYVSNGRCEAVSILCASYNQQTGQCLSCISQHFLQDGECIYPSIYDENCSRYQGSFCSQCRTSYYLQSFTCHPVDTQCLSFNHATNVCERCSNGRVPQGPQCL